MFQEYNFRLKDALMLKKLFADLEGTVERVQIDFLQSANMVVINCQDSHHMAHFNCVIKRKAFSNFVCPADTSISVQVSRLVRIFTCIEFGDWCDISLHKRAPHVLEFNFEKTKDENCQVWLNTEHGEEEMYDLPDLAQRPFVKMMSEDFARHVNAFGRLDQDIQLRSTKDTFSIATSCEAADITGQRVIHPSKTTFFNLNDAPDTSNTFNSAFLVSASKFSNLHSDVTLYPHNLDPFCISYYFGSSECGRLDIHLAPRID
eukprot:GEMP01063582.1.p1 GENE.GEMP01063582.1~~GEMP01063582.1.p1  ORF type:complete len:261 (+),score=45.98 GEMP01063582.1:110-892(+)